MNPPAKILRQLFVNQFYAENAGPFVLVFTMMFVIVGSTHGHGLYAYHHSLAVGMLSNWGFLLGMFSVWFLYARKYISYVATTMRQPAYNFIDIFNRLNKTKQFILFISVEIWLLLPVILYAIFVVTIGIENQYYLPAISIIVFLTLIVLTGATLHVQGLNNLHKNIFPPRQNPTSSTPIPTSYPFVLLLFFIKKQKTVWLGIKIFTCSILYLIARNNIGTYYDISLPFLFFNFGILANGIMVFKAREFEESNLPFYRCLPVSLIKRLLQYSFVYAVMLAPEFLMVALLTPTYLHFADALSFSFCAFSLLLLVNTISQLQQFGKKEFAAVSLLLFAVQYVFMLVAGLVALWLFFLLLAVALFLFRYYKYDWVTKE